VWWPVSLVAGKVFRRTLILAPLRPIRRASPDNRSSCSRLEAIRAAPP
jgi:hypothetical protein